MTQEELLLTGDGIRLEGSLSLPEQEGPFGIVILCHPHPLYGGNMDNNIVEAVCQKAGERGLASLKFNFRGVGRSGGHFGGGIEEQKDVQAAISFTEVHPKIDPRRIGLCGYSFGSQVAFSVAVKDPRVRAVAGISPFIQPANLFDHYSPPKLFICGTDDEFINAESLAQVVRAVPEPKELILYPGADHFWRGQEEEIAGKVADFFARLF